jgi:hypothetical protein
LSSILVRLKVHAYKHVRKLKFVNEQILLLRFRLSFSGQVGRITSQQASLLEDSIFQSAPAEGAG